MYSTLQTSSDTQQTQDVFAGYNHNLRIGDNEFYDLCNLTSDNYPVLSTRHTRGQYAENCNVQGMIAKDALCYVDGQYFVMNQYKYDLGLSEAEDMCPKQLISMGAYVIILPDKKYINTASPEDRGSIEASFTAASTVTFSPCDLDGTVYKADYIQATEPSEPANMAYWMDTSQTPHSLKQWSESAGTWSSVVTTYVRIYSAGIGGAFNQYDGVRISGITDVSGDTAEQIEALNGSAIIYARDDNYIVIVGLLDAETTADVQISVSRKMPAMDYVVENDNRLWGCRYGLNNDGEVVNELYACKLGDFRNWECFMGISTDSYTASIGSDGQFTGAITHLGYPLFFKENCLHKVYGQIPSNFQIQNTACRGVQKGCGKSLAIVNEILYYKSRHAVCSYDGSLPTEVSSQLGESIYDNAIAAAHRNKYYISMEDTETSERSLFVYDTAKGLWHRESDPTPVCFCSCRNELYCATGSSIITMLGSGEDMEDTVEWFAETGIINASSPERQYLKRIHIRMILEPGSHMQIMVQYDSSGIWESLGAMQGIDMQSFTFSVRPRRCDHLRFRLEGSGKARVFAITRDLSEGSDKP